MNWSREFPAAHPEPGHHGGNRRPQTPWETYAQALLLSNEASYVN